MKPTEALDRLFVDVLTALGQGKVSAETWLESEGELLDGHCDDDGKVQINEASVLVPTLLHELVHRVRPEYTERGATRWATMLLRHISRAQVERIYEMYQVRKDT